eukprot:CAMPEP_0176053806 /NCGR_PEP_ID=MMETSP0120_2-20121206/26767_1 /TAXON_ID=160619 /ORGANISM="Kryptoperidinium foliaceum, Strain CCMP 1326" /LENGTH=72 /DNA_ID=CAMNT_0017387267 /DNA_START=74 /DNA_END=288 /DNA_ORIENTATION=-
MKATAEGDGALFRGHLNVAHQRIVVRGDDHVHILDSLAEAAIHVLGLHLQLENAAVDLIHEQARLHTLGQGL